MSLHHIKNVEHYLSKKVKFTLKNNGHLIINEYVGPDRLQFQKKQIIKIKEAIKLTPKIYRKRYLSNKYKNNYYGSGFLRVYLSDPSECTDSSSIMPSIYNHFSIVSEKPYGGNILMNVLKDISHNFVKLDANKEKALNDLFEFEDNYLKNNKSHFIFGIYQKTD